MNPRPCNICRDRLQGSSLSLICSYILGFCSDTLDFDRNMKIDGFWLRLMKPQRTEKEAALAVVSLVPFHL